MCTINFRFWRKIYLTPVCTHYNVECKFLYQVSIHFHKALIILKEGTITTMLEHRYGLSMKNTRKRKKRQLTSGTVVLMFSAQAKELVKTMHYINKTLYTQIELIQKLDINHICHCVIGRFHKILRPQNKFIDQNPITALFSITNCLLISTKYAEVQP